MNFFARAARFPGVFKDNFDSGSQIVIADPAGDPSKVLEGFHMTVEEALLPLGGKRHCKGSVRKAQPHYKELHFLALAGDDRVRLPPIGLGILPWVIFEREKDIGSTSRLQEASHVQANG